MDDSPEPQVSIVVPSYRQGRFLEGCLESLLRQEGVTIEIIVLDNCSDDETGAILSAYGPRLSRVETRRDRGQADALRRGFAMARGQILGWLNCDDMLMPGAVQRAVEVFRREEAVDVVYGHCAHLNVAGDFIGYFHYISEYDEEELRNFNDFIPQPSTFFRRSAYERTQGIDPTLHYAMDWDLWCQMAKAGARFHFLPEVLSGARIHPDAKTVRGGLHRLIEVSRVNIRHKTLFLPMMPTLFVAHHVLSRVRISRMGPLYRWLKRQWERAGGRFIPRKVVFGIGHGPQIEDQPAVVRFPVYRRAAGVRFHATRKVNRSRVRIMGREAEGSHDDRSLAFASGRFLDAVEVVIDDYAGPLPNGFELHPHAEGIPGGSEVPDGPE